MCNYFCAQEHMSAAVLVLPSKLLCSSVSQLERFLLANSWSWCVFILCRRYQHYKWGILYTNSCSDIFTCSFM